MTALVIRVEMWKEGTEILKEGKMQPYDVGAQIQLKHLGCRTDIIRHECRKENSGTALQ